MRCNGGLRERRDLVRLADIEPMHGDLARARFRDLRGGGLQAGLVAVGDRQIAAAQRQFMRERAADAAGGSGHGSGGSRDRGHVG
ncbi:hypothetical protein ACVIM5_005065 [Bradyrhizobium sp. USDA 4512]